MVRNTVVFAGLFLASLAFVLDTTATSAAACGRCGCGGCGGCGYGGCGYGCGGCYGVSSYGGCYGCGGYGGYCGYGCGGPACGTACCATPVTIAPTCYAYPGSISIAGAPRQQYYVSPALPVSTYGLPVQMPLGSTLRTSPPLMANGSR
jgi:hypothetical protein